MTDVDFTQRVLGGPGWFYLSKFSLDANPASVAELLNGFVPFRVEMEYYAQRLKMEGYHPSFRHVSEGEEIPRYEIIRTETRLEDGSIHATLDGFKEWNHANR